MKWIEDRREHLIAANHSRQQLHKIRAAVDADGVILAIDDVYFHDQGAYVRTHAARVVHMTAGILPGPYRVPAYRAIGHFRLTNKTPAATYRAPGRYETTFVRERLVDAIAAQLGMDRVEIRRRNTISAAELPYPRPLEALGEEIHYDTGVNVAELNLFSSFLTPKAEAPRNAPWFFSKNRTERKEEVAVRRLDDVLEACLDGIASPRMYLKMDTQGFDLEVVKGAESVLPSMLALQTEISFKSIYDEMPGFMESIKELQARGFDVTDFLPVTSAVDQLSAIEMDCIMARSPQPKGPAAGIRSSSGGAS